jgi:hypothetical protein
MPGILQQHAPSPPQHALRSGTLYETKASHATEEHCIASPRRRKAPAECNCARRGRARTSGMSSAASSAFASCATFQLPISGWFRKVYLRQGYGGLGLRRGSLRHS